MIEEWITGLAAASLIPAVALVAKALISKVLESKTKDVITTDAQGRSETVVVRAAAGPAEIRERIDEAYSFEDEIASALERLGNKNRDLKTHTARQVDFIVQLPTGKLALEVKLALDRVDGKAMERYLGAEDHLSHLLLVSRAPPSQRLVETIKGFVSDRQVSLLTVPKGSDAGPLIEKAVMRIASEASGA